MKFVRKQATPVQGCEFAPVAGSRYAFIEFPMSLTALPRIKIIRTEAGVLYIYLYFRVYL